MPSSPLRPTSPLADRDREYVDFALRKTKTKPTLEWACAAARMSSKTQSEDDDIEEMVLDASGDTEDELDLHEAITPSSSAGRDSKIWRNKKANFKKTEGGSSQISDHDHLATPKAKLPSRLKEQVQPSVAVPDEDVMDAALALCGLGKGFNLGTPKQ